MLYNTIPTNTEEETLLKQSKTSLKGIVAGAAVTSFILGIVAATAMSPTYTPKQTSLTSTSRARRSRTTTARYPTEPAKDYKQDTLPRPAQSPFLSLSLPSLK